jgi:hypothetical protein
MKEKSCLTLTFKMGCALGVFLVCIGCSKTGGDVTGTVTLNGKAVPSGSVVFYDEKGTKYGAPISRDGTYRMLKPPKGAMKVTVEPLPSSDEPGGFAPRPSSAALEPGTNKPTASAAAKVEPVPIPDKYKDPKTSGFSLTVTGSSQTFDIPLVGDSGEKK